LSSGKKPKYFEIILVAAGLVVVITAGLFVVTGWMLDVTRALYVDEATQQEAVEARIRPIGEVAIAGLDEAAEEAEERIDAPGPMEEPDTVAAAPREIDGAAVYRTACTVCHGPGIAGAPRTGDADTWEPRLAQGMDTLVRHAIDGFQGDAGYMPPRGGHANLSDEEVRASVQYMVDAIL
jgi:cytochrome c5